MTNVSSDGRAHTYLDDIKYQSVKESRRTSFVSTDHQIVAQNAQAMKELEKIRKLRTADYKRQENVYLQKLNKLQHMKCLNNSTNTSSKMERRHSAPSVFWAQTSEAEGEELSNHIHADSKFIQRSQTAIINPHPSASSQNQKHSKDNSQNSSIPSRKSYRSSPETRRMSFDLQQETSRVALKKIDLIVQNQKRRATIAEGVKSDFLSTLRMKTDRSFSIDEEDISD